MRLAIVGSRSFNDYPSFEKEILDNIDISNVTEIISGGAVGTDRLAEIFADKYNIPIKILSPDWKRYGKRAGIIRNIDIVKEAELVFAFWDGVSKGTSFGIREAIKRNVCLRVVEKIEGLKGLLE